MSKVADEKTKLTASFFNTLGSAFLITGVVAPVVALSYGLPGPKADWTALLFTAVWLVAGAGLHLVARRVLGRLTP